MLDPDEPVSIGAMVGPEAFMEVKYLAHAKQMQALELIPEIAGEFERAFGRDSGGLIRTYRSEDAETIVVALGSVLGTIKDTVDELRDEGVSIGAVGITLVPARSRSMRCARRWATPSAWSCWRRRSPSASAGSSRANVRMALAGIQLHGYTVIAGLGGRPITKASLHGLFTDAAADRLEPLTFLDMDWDVVNRELARMGASRASGPHAENILRDLGAVAAGPV